MPDRPHRVSFTPRGYRGRCVFCEIARGAEPAHVILDEPDFLAFLDAHPAFYGHTLVVPRRHVQTYDQLPLGLARGWVATGQRVQRAVERGMQAEGALLIMNNVVSQSVPHLHMHVVPRRRDDGLRLFLGPRRRYDSDAQAESVAERIRAALDA